MTSAEQARRSESRYSRDGRYGAQAAAVDQPRTTRRSSTSARHIASRSEGIDAYTAKRKKKTRGRIFKGVLITLLVAFVGICGAAAAFFFDINNRLTGDLPEDLREQLVAVDPQDPFYMLLLGVDKSDERSGEWGSSTANFRADTIILARVDPPAQKVALVSIPRDTMVDMGEHGEDKILAVRGNRLRAVHLHRRHHRWH